ncbi:MAG: hypothetical protein AAFU38_14080 [Bacteroidota bacterium]
MSAPIPAGYTPHLQTHEGFRYRVVLGYVPTGSGTPPMIESYEVWRIWDGAEGRFRAMEYASATTALSHAARLNAQSGDLFAPASPP